MDPEQRSGDTLRVNDEKEVTDHLETVCEGETPKPTTIAAGQDDSETDGTYYRSVRFIGSVTALILTANCTFISYTIPVSDSITHPVNTSPGRLNCNHSIPGQPPHRH